MKPAPHITVNKNAVPNDPRSPFITSTAHWHPGSDHTRLRRTRHRIDLANWIADVLDAPSDESVIASVREKVTAQCRKYPVYG